jgi:hypothetical protein
MDCDNARSVLALIAAVQMNAKQKRPARSRTGITPLLAVDTSDELHNRIERWAARQTDKPSLFEAARRLIEIGLGGSKPVTRHNPKAAAKASAMAERAVEPLIDKTAPPVERAKRKRRLIKGPREFRGLRND